MINIKWFGHSMWKIWNEEVSLITDPFTDIGYPMPENETANIVLSSHDHFDHNNIQLIKGNPQVVNTKGNFEIKGVKIETFPVWHDETSGSERGSNLLMKFTISGKTFLHCGDLGHICTADVISKLGKIDVLFIPVGGFYTIDAKTAKAIVEMIKPIIVFPMHYKTPILDFPIATIEEYLKLIDDHKQISANEIELTEEDFTKSQTIILNYK
jgi:L-ascorbate metabolism protein UlaG (beta-lactamase superfamily)